MDEACQMLAANKGRAAVLAGGTDLLVQMRANSKRLAQTDYLVDISHIEGLDRIEEDGAFIRMGPMVVHSAIADSPLLRAEAPFLCEACLSVGSPQIRNRGTLGGNICNASPAADAVAPLIALEAELTIQSVRGLRRIALKSFFVKPYTTDLEADEFVTQIGFRRLPQGAGTVFLKLGRRKALAISRMNVAVAVAVGADGRLCDVRIAPGCVFATPVRCTAAEAALMQSQSPWDAAEEAGRLVSQEMVEKTGVRWSTEYKKPVIETLVRRAVLAACKGLEGACP